MKQSFVSAIAVLFCCAVLAIVVAFGYSRYKAAEVDNAAFGAQLQTGTNDQQLAAHMPAQLSSRPNAGDVGAVASPAGQ